MIIKIKKYYSIFGFKETIKKIIRYMVFIYKTHIKTGCSYKLSRGDKKQITLKEKKVFVFNNKSFFDLDDISNLKSIIEYLNENGYAIYYFYKSKTKKASKLMPLNAHIYFKKYVSYTNDINNFDFLITADCDSEFDNLIQKSKEKKCNIISLHEMDNPSVIADSIMKNNIISSEFYKNISIIVLNHNNKNVIDKCIDSLINHNHRYNYEIIVVDNQSTDGSYENIKKTYSKIKLLRNTKNGCSSGRNIGAELAKGKYLVFLDSDQWVKNDFWLDNYIQIYTKYKNIGAIGWTAGWFNRKGFSYHTVDNFEYRYMPPGGLFRKDIGYIGSGGMMLKKSLFKQIKGFDINYDPTCYEDTDISLKVRNLGKEIVYCPYLGIVHLPHQTTGQKDIKHNELIDRNGNYFVKKWKIKNPSLLKYKK